MSASGLDLLVACHADGAEFLASVLDKPFGDPTGEIERKARIAYDRWTFPVSRALGVVLSPVIGKSLVVVVKATT